MAYIVLCSPSYNTHTNINKEIRVTRATSKVGVPGTPGTVDLTHALRRLAPKTTVTGPSHDGHGWRTPDSIMSTGSRSGLSSLNSFHYPEKLKVCTFTCNQRLDVVTETLSLQRNDSSLRTNKSLLSVSASGRRIAFPICPARTSYCLYPPVVFFFIYTTRKKQKTIAKMASRRKRKTVGRSVFRFAKFSLDCGTRTISLFVFHHVIISIMALVIAVTWTRWNSITTA